MKTFNILPTDARRFAIIERLLTAETHNRFILEWLFVEGKSEMFSGAENILDEATGFSTGERILIEVAVCIWFNHEGVATMWDICRRLDATNFKAVMNAFRDYRNL